MTTHILQSTNALDVSSFQTLDTIIEVPDVGPRHLLIFTGIAAARWESRGGVEPLTVIVKLGTIVSENPKEGDWTAVVGLSNIDNRDSDFIFAVNSTSIDIDPSTNELQLSVDIAVLGVGVATLNSFTFQVTVLTEPPKVELGSLLVRGQDFAPRCLVQTGGRWEGLVTLTAPAPRDIDVFISSDNPAAAPLRGPPGNPSFTSVTITKGSTSAIFLAAPTFNAGAVIDIDVIISAELVAGNKTAVVTVSRPPQ